MADDNKRGPSFHQDPSSPDGASVVLTTETEESESESEPEAGAEDITPSGDESACGHYKRNCKLKAKCCGKFYPCRFCHDEDNTHEMNRHKVEQVQCIKCQAVQDVSQICTSCKVLFGEYFCPVCRLYDVNNNQFHCDKCGICRVGPKDNFYHCDTCNACLSKELLGKHKCLDNISMSPCPICQELLHTSRLGMHIPKCGHMIHQKCLVTYYKQGHYQCPLCKESLEDMSEIWKEMDKAVAETVMPEELRNLEVEILCQDCHQQCKQKFNTEGIKCTHCGSYNTARV